MYTCASTECGLGGTQIKIVGMCEHLRKKIIIYITNTVRCTVSETYQRGKGKNYDSCTQTEVVSWTCLGCRLN